MSLLGSLGGAAGGPGAGQAMPGGLAGLMGAGRPPMGPGGGPMPPGMGGPPMPPPGLGMGGMRPPTGPFPVQQPPMAPGMGGGPGMGPGGPGGPGMPGGGSVMPPGMHGAMQVIVGQCADMLQKAIQVGDPMSPISARLQKVQQELQAIAMDLPGSLHPLGVSNPSGAFGPGPEGALNLFRNSPDVPPPPANLGMAPQGQGSQNPLARIPPLS